MKARDIMTSNVVCVGPDTDVRDVARLLLARHVSAVPVVDASHRLLGILSEGDLMRRPELGTQRQRAWWLDLVARADDEQIKTFIRSHGRSAADVMTRKVVSVSENADVSEIARLLEQHRIKRVPVVRDGKVVGIVSRANVIQGLAAGEPDRDAADDESVKAAIDALSESEGWMTHGCLNATVRDGAVEVWGWVESEDERKAIRLAIESIPGVRSVESHLGMIAPYLRGT